MSLEILPTEILFQITNHLSTCEQVVNMMKTSKYFHHVINSNLEYILKNNSSKEQLKEAFKSVLVSKQTSIANRFMDNLNLGFDQNLQFWLTKFGNLEMLKHFLEDKNRFKNYDLNSGLNIACKCGSVEKTIFLLTQGASIKQLTSCLKMQINAEEGNLEMVKLMCNFNNPSCGSNKPLFVSLLNGHIDIAKYLFTFEEVVTVFKNDECFLSDLIRGNANVKSIKFVLKNGCDLNYKNCKSLRTVCKYGRHKLIKHLVAQKEINGRLKNGSQLIIRPAAVYNKPKIFRELFKFDWFDPMYKGKKLLIQTCLDYGSYKALKVLVNHPKVKERTRLLSNLLDSKDMKTVLKYMEN